MGSRNQILMGSLVSSVRIGAVAVAVTLSSCGVNHEEKTGKETGGVSDDATDSEMLGLTQAQCTTAQISQITVSPRGQLYINAPEVLDNARAKNILSGTSGPGGAWSFAFAMREILELPENPGTDFARIDAEDKAVDNFISMYGANTVNGVVASNRQIARDVLRAAWGTIQVTPPAQSGITPKPVSKKWLGGAPFKLVAIVNRMDIVKRTSSGAVSDTTAGEGRLVFGFTGRSSATVIFEYDLPIGAASGSSPTLTQNSWTEEWKKLKPFLTDTNPTRPGVQPNEGLTTQPTIPAGVNGINAENYRKALQGITDKFVLRGAQKVPGSLLARQAAISQIRTNEFIQSPWQLREIIRDRSSPGVVKLKNTTTKNAFSVANKSDTALGAWVDLNVTCQGTANGSTQPFGNCKFIALNNSLPDTVTQTGRTFRLGPTADADFRQWFGVDRNNIKRRFFALNTCDGCHQSEGLALFVHTDQRNGNPSRFLTSQHSVGSFSEEADLARRLRNFKNLVCLAATSASQLDISASYSPVAPLEKRLGVSEMVH